jgi:hypothetical protein
MSLARVVVTAQSNGALEMLQRRVGGILKGLAHVSKIYPDQYQIGKVNPDLVVAYAKGLRVEEIKSWYPGKPFIAVELVIHSTGIRSIKQIDEDKIIGIVAKHRRCANYFLEEITKSISLNNRLVTGCFDDVNKSISADVYLISGEMEEDTKNRALRVIPSHKLVMVSRTISPYSAAELINVTYEINREKKERGFVGYRRAVEA